MISLFCFFFSLSFFHVVCFCFLSNESFVHLSPLVTGVRVIDVILLFLAPYLLCFSTSFVSFHFISFHFILARLNRALIPLNRIVAFDVYVMLRLKFEGN